ncbi:hypothetical protein CHUAL_004444 [Chamberlinius hualienensis]
MSGLRFGLQILSSTSPLNGYNMRLYNWEILKKTCSKKFSNFESLAMQTRKFCKSSSLLASDKTQEKHVDESFTHFGFETVKDSEKTGRVYEVFKNVAAKYDLMNDAMSLGIHRLWKDEFVKMLHPTPGINVLDVAGGTGDIAFRIIHSLRTLEKFTKKKEENNENLDSPSRVSKVVVSDINQQMLDVGKERAKQRGYFNDLQWLCANAEELPVEDNSFDAYTIAFGIRNVTHIDKALDEAYRVLKPGGRFLCMEFSHLTNPLMQKIYDAYSFQVIPPMGQILARDWKSYQYLVESIRKFPNQETFSQMIREAGFSSVTYTNFTFGVTAIHSGFKL